MTRAIRRRRRTEMERACRKALADVGVHDAGTVAAAASRAITTGTAPADAVRQIRQVAADRIESHRPRWYVRAWRATVWGVSYRWRRIDAWIARRIAPGGP